MARTAQQRRAESANDDGATSNATPFERFDALVRQVVSVSKAQVDGERKANARRTKRRK